MEVTWYKADIAGHGVSKVVLHVDHAAALAEATEKAWREAAQFALERFGSLSKDNVGVGVENTLLNMRGRAKLAKLKGTATEGKR